MESLKKLLLLSLLAAAVADFTANCPSDCKCGWASGNKQATCAHAGLHDIPERLSPDIQILNLTGNPLNEIRKHALSNAGLMNLKRLLLKECKLTTIHKEGFSGLTILIELDLSKNDLKTLHVDTFKETSKIRWISLNDNQIEQLDDGLFSNLPFLHGVDLSNNRIVQIGAKTFNNVPKLNNLRLDNNKLEHLDKDVLSCLAPYSSLDVNDNPWRCDCFLQSLINWVKDQKFDMKLVACAEPAEVHGKLWTELGANDLVCTVNQVSSTTPPKVGMTAQTPDSNVNK